MNPPEPCMPRARRQDQHSFRAWKVKTLERLERAFLQETLRNHGGNVTRAARALEVHRSTLQRLMRRHHLPGA
jgi:transcriptional regulator with GAF, ATPase, and Fis domain